MQEDKWVARALDLGATGAVWLDTSAIQLRTEFRKLCEQNACRNYDTNWMCPPAIGSMQECQSRLKAFTRAMVVQRVCHLKDWMDLEGMEEGAQMHQEILCTLRQEMEQETDVLALSSGGCKLCECCAYLEDQQPCRQPDRAMSSLEAYGMDVTALIEQAGLPYAWTSNVVYYTGIVLC